MITFSQLGKFGRLGNVLWQYAALRGIGLKTNNEIAIPLELYEWHGQTCLIDNFNINCEMWSQKQFSDNIKQRYVNTGKPQLFDIDAFTITDTTDYAGYFQNIKYFKGYEDTIKQDLQLTKPLKNTAVQYHYNLRRMTGDKPLVSIHIRRGDLVSGKNHENVELYYGKNGIYTVYLKQALETMRYKLGHNLNFLVFTGGNHGIHLQEDIEWCKQYLSNEKVFFCEGMIDIEDFAIMSMCDHHINGMATSFGWWASYLNLNPNKIIIAPKYYVWDWKDSLPDYVKLNEFYPKEWLVI